MKTINLELKMTNNCNKKYIQIIISVIVVWPFATPYENKNDSMIDQKFPNL